MCSNDRKRGVHGPDVAAFLKELAEEDSGTHRIVSERDGVSTELWLEGGEVRSREASSTTAFEAAARSGFAGLVPKLERELGGLEAADLDGIETEIRDVTHSSGAAMCKALLERVDARLPEIRQADGAAPEVRQVLRLAPGAGAG